MHRFYCSGVRIQWKWRPKRRTVLCRLFLIFITRAKAAAQNPIYRIHCLCRVPTANAFWRTSAAYSLITVLFLVVSSSDAAAVIYHIYYCCYYLHICRIVSTGVRWFVLFGSRRAYESNHKLHACRRHHQLNRCGNSVYCIFLTNLSLVLCGNVLYTQTRRTYLYHTQ